MNRMGTALLFLATIAVVNSSVVNSAVAFTARRLQLTTQAGPTLSNWNKGISTTPAVLAVADTIQDVADVVADSGTYPSPVIAVGSMHSVTEVLVNNGGTIISMAKLNRVLQLDQARGTVRVQAGVKLADLHDWLGNQGWEISYSAEIGDATVGSLVTTTSKDSSVRGPGFLSALVTEVLAVADTGIFFILRKGVDDAQLGRFISSYGLMGIAVEVELQARPQVMVTTKTFIKAPGFTDATYRAFAGAVRLLRAASDNVFVLSDVKLGLSFIESRSKTPTPSPLLLNNPINKAALASFQKCKYQTFLTGTLPLAACAPTAVASVAPILTIFHYRRSLVNRYPPVTSTQQREDFSYVEFQTDARLTGFADNLAAVYAFVRDYGRSTGFYPTGMATFFITRPGGKPYSNYSGPAGISYTLDPVYSDPTDPKWLAFLDAFNAFLAPRPGVLLSLSQTRRTLPSQGPPIPAVDARQRFTTPYLAQFIAA